MYAIYNNKQSNLNRIISFLKRNLVKLMSFSIRSKCHKLENQKKKISTEGTSKLEKTIVDKDKRYAFVFTFSMVL